MKLHERYAVYIVGGYVRDKLLNISPRDKDYVVVGATPEIMENYGFKKVGADFPVFLCPISGEEYALARTERKTGKGYNGFSVDFSKTITLEEDLKRRDLSINSMAMDSNGNIIDFFNGKNDIKNKILKHTSEAFNEDPLRVYRTARFAAQLDGFIVHESTIALMTSLDSELTTLTQERIWKELEKALKARNTFRFFEVLKTSNLIHHFFKNNTDYEIAIEELKKFNTFEEKVIALRNANISMIKNSNLIRLIKCAKVLLDNVSKKSSVKLYKMLDYRRRPIPSVLNILAEEDKERLLKHFKMFEMNPLDVTGKNSIDIPRLIEEHMENLIKI